MGLDGGQIAPVAPRAPVATKETRRRVQEILINWLLDRGVTRPGGMNVSDWEERQKEICARLAYLTADELERLREFILNFSARSRLKSKPMPPLVWILDAATHSVRPCPPSDSEMVRAFMSGPKGLQAFDEGYAPGLLLYLKDMGNVPTTRFAWDEVRSRQTKHQDLAAQITAKEPSARKPSEVQYLEWWERLVSRAHALVHLDQWSTVDASD